jgi:hypothetical protein
MDMQHSDGIATAQTMRDEFGPGASDEYRTVYRFDSSALRRGCAVLGLFADPRGLKRLLPGR